MKTLTKLTLGAAIAVMTGFSAMAQQINPLENPNYGATPEERKTNWGILTWQSDAAKIQDWDTAAYYTGVLLKAAPAAHSSIYVNGANAYRNRIQRATSPEQKEMLIDSLMLIYDMRAKYFGDHPTQGTAYILETKASMYNALNQLDGANVRKFYKEAIDAAGDAVKPSLVIQYFQQMVNGFGATDITSEELIASYEELTPLVAKGTREEQDQLTSMLASSGAADCAVLEDLFTRQLAEKPGDLDILKKAFGLMTMAKCDSDFYISVGEQLYKLEPTSNIAIGLAVLFENRKQYDRAIPYLNEQLETETDLSAKADLYVRIAASEYGQNRFSATAQNARQAIALNPANGYAHMLLANSYIGGQSGCSDFTRSAVVWLAYDEYVRARDALTGDSSAAGVLELINGQIASCRANFPTNEDIFMYGHQVNGSYTVNCGWISGTTTVRAR
jgi:tetratricopeptide (TPR) repeat protein